MRDDPFSSFRQLEQTIKDNLKRNPHYYDPPAPPGAPSGEKLWTPMPKWDDDNGRLHNVQAKPVVRSTMLESDFEAMVEKTWAVMVQSGIGRSREELRVDLARRIAQRGTEIVPNKPVPPAPDPRIVGSVGGEGSFWGDKDVHEVEEKAMLLDRYVKAVVEAHEAGQITKEELIKLMENPDVGVKHMLDWDPR